MIVIVAEKADVGNKIAAALDKITLSSGKVVTFATLKANEKAVKEQQANDGFLKINYNGEECFVTWGLGHLCGLKDVKDYDPSITSWYKMPLPFKPDKYEIQLRRKDGKTDPKAKKQFGIVKALINKARLIINATDFDREGEVIFAYIYELAKCTKPVKRACFTSQTQSGIKEAFDNLRDGKEMKNIEMAGRVRGIEDWAVGVNLTVAMSIKNPGRGVFSVGRVQTATLNMVVEKELAIRSFKSTPYWALEAKFKTATGEEYEAHHHIERIEDRTEADRLFLKVNGQNGTITDIKKKRAEKEVPLLYSLSALQMEANAKFGFTLNQTLEIAQKLYDEGYTTYPRTKSQYLTEDMEPYVNKILDLLAKKSEYTKLIDGKVRRFDRKHYFDDKKVESHFAIIPTDNVPKSLSTNEAKIYDLICRSVIRMLYGPAVIEQTKIVTTVNGEDFHSNGSTIVEPGWMAVGDSSKEKMLPALSIGQPVSGKYELQSKKTEPPKRFTEKTLLAAMLSAGKTIDDAVLRKILSDPKTGGIGTEATRAKIIETLIDREYIVREGKTISATDRGIELIEKLPVQDVKSAEMTARWEQRLDGIAKGTENPDDFLRDIEESIKQWIEEINKKVAVVSKASSIDLLGVDCPVCGKPMTIKNWGYGCSGWKDGCKFSIGTICKKKLTVNQAKMLITSGKSPLIKGFVSKAGKSFDAYLVLKIPNIEFEFPTRK